MNNKKLTTLAVLTICSATLAIAAPSKAPESKSSSDMDSVPAQTDQQEFFNETVLHNALALKVTGNISHNEKSQGTNVELKRNLKDKKRGIKGSTGGRCLPYPECKAPDF